MTMDNRDAFDLFDSDHDGLLSKEEVTLGLCLLAEPLSEHDVDFLLEVCDRDGDGKLSPPEFARLRELAPAPYYGGEPMFATFESPQIDARSFGAYLNRRGIAVRLEKITSFLRNLDPRPRPALHRRLYGSFVSAYRRVQRRSGVRPAQR